MHTRTRVITVGEPLAVDVGSRRRRLAFQLATEVTRRLADPATLERARACFRCQTTHPELRVWQPAGLERGDVGLALALTEMSRHRPEEGWDLAAHAVMNRAGRAVAADRSLLTGTAGLGAAIWCASRAGRRYARARAVLDGMRRRQIEELIAQPNASWELFTGLTGCLAAWSLTHADLPEPGVEAADALAMTLDPAGGAWRPRPPDGQVDGGMAHGVAGPLTLLALLRIGGQVGGTGIDRAINRGARWLCRHTWGGVAAPGWCIGVAGTARALWLAGHAVGDPDYREFAQAAITTLCRHAATVRSTALCHGLAGVLLVLVLFAHETGDALIGSAVADLVDELINRFEPDSVLGFRDREVSGNPVDDPGLLTGAAGVALVLATVWAGRVPPWTRLLLLT